MLDEALEVDGSGDYVRVNSVNADNSSAGTYAFWVYYRASRNYDGFISSDSANPVIHCFDGKLTVIIKAASGVNEIDFSGNEIPLNEWVHYALTYDSSGAVLYKNGLRDAADSSGVSTYRSTTSFYIGSDRSIANARRR